MRPLSDQVVIVTGASSGIGAAVVHRLATQGARVLATARRPDLLAPLVAEFGARVRAVAADVTEPADRLQIVETALATWGRIDALVNNAGFGQRGPVELVPLAALRRNFEVNVFALVGLTQLVLPHLRANHPDAAGSRGRVINIGSVAGRIARPLSSVYDATKHALEALNDGLRGELRPFGVQVVLVRPGFIRTGFADAAAEVSAATLEAAAAGPYAPLVDAHRSGTQRLHRLAGTPRDIADVVARALTADRPRSHYAAPGHARVFLFFRWLAPVWLLDRLLGPPRPRR